MAQGKEKGPSSGSLLCVWVTRTLCWGSDKRTCPRLSSLHNMLTCFIWGRYGLGWYGERNDVWGGVAARDAPRLRVVLGPLLRVAASMWTLHLMLPSALLHDVIPKGQGQREGTDGDMS